MDPRLETTLMLLGAGVCAVGAGLLMGTQPELAAALGAAAGTLLGWAGFKRPVDR